MIKFDDAVVTRQCSYLADRRLGSQTSQTRCDIRDILTAERQARAHVVHGNGIPLLVLQQQLVIVGGVAA